MKWIMPMETEYRKAGLRMPRLWRERCACGHPIRAICPSVGQAAMAEHQRYASCPLPGTPPLRSHQRLTADDIFWGP